MIEIGTKVRFQNHNAYRAGTVEDRYQAGDGTMAYEVRDDETGTLVSRREASLLPVAETLADVLNDLRTRPDGIEHGFKVSDEATARKLVHHAEGYRVAWVAVDDGVLVWKVKTLAPIDYCDLP